LTIAFPVEGEANKLPATEPEGSLHNSATRNYPEPLQSSSHYKNLLFFFFFFLFVFFYSRSQSNKWPVPASPLYPASSLFNGLPSLRLPTGR